MIFFAGWAATALVSALRRMNFNTLSVLLVGEGEPLRRLAADGTLAGGYLFNDNRQLYFVPPSPSLDCQRRRTGKVT